MKRLPIVVVLLSISLLSHSAAIEPRDIIVAWSIDTPTVPEAHHGRYIENIGSVPIRATLQWKTTWGQWEDIKAETFQPGERGNVVSNKVYFHQRLVIENLSDNEVAEVDWSYN